GHHRRAARGGERGDRRAARARHPPPGFSVLAGADLEGAAAMSLREKKKLKTRERIRTAAAELFTRHGYGAATMRQIARRAHVGLGTLFNYAGDKRDLVFLIFNEELNATTDVALAAPRPGQALADQLLAVFAVHYRWLAEKPALARILLQELTFYSSGKQ